MTDTVTLSEAPGLLASTVAVGEALGDAEGDKSPPKRVLLRKRVSEISQKLFLFTAVTLLSFHLGRLCIDATPSVDGGMNEHS